MSVTESDIHDPLQSKKTLRACFSPEGQCEHDILRSIAKAKHSIKVHAYTLTSPAIADALLDAKGRGVDVVLLVDSSQMTSKYSKVKQLLQNGIPVFLDKVPGLAHNKIMIIDDALLLTGSYNWSNAAHKRNAENLLFIKDQGLLSVYLTNWNRHLDQGMRMSFVSTQR